MAYAGIVGVPPIMGLYTIVPALVAYALLGTSRQLVVGPDTATGLISALTVAAVAVQGTAEYNALASILAVLIGLLFLLFGAMRMGWVAAFVSTPVMRGFIEGLVYVTIIGQVPHLLGIEGGSGNFACGQMHRHSRRCGQRMQRPCPGSRSAHGRARPRSARLGSCP